jgi:Asp-tRNA(Asn)/Glu-tRNA(Gln) amidotransferase A subunit family amidase
VSQQKPLPLEGFRIGIKDLFHLKGTRTSLCNRAFNELHPRQSTTAKTIAHLISKGVHIVGKNHLSSFALQEHPTQSVDYESPFNPRGDGYQIAGGSSSGSASAIASYEWLDFAVATDGDYTYPYILVHRSHGTATGSVRIPALANGCFALRPSTGVVPTDGVVSVYPGFDTPGLIGRDLNRFHQFVSAWYGEELANRPLKTPKILLPTDFYVSIDEEQVKLINHFVADLEQTLKTKVERRSIAETWSESAPVKEQDLNVYLQNVRPL